MERNDNEPLESQASTLDNGKFKIKVSRFTTKIVIELENSENQKTYSYEFHQGENQESPPFVKTVPNFYATLIQALRSSQEGEKLQILIPENLEKKQAEAVLYYILKTDSGKVIPLKFSFLMNEIHPHVPISFESKEIAPLELENSQHLAESQWVPLAELEVELQNMLRRSGGHHDEASLLLSSIIQDSQGVNEKQEELENKKDKVEEKEEVKNEERQGQGQGAPQEQNDEIEERLKRLKSEMETKFEGQIKRIMQDYTVLSAAVNSNKSQIRIVESKIWGDSIKTTPEDIVKESFAARLEGMIAKSERRFKTLEEKLNQCETSLIKDFEELKESQREINKDDLTDRLEHINAWMESVKAEPSENKKLEAQITELKKTLENSQRNFESKISQLEILQEIKAQMRKLTIPSNKELCSFEKQKLQFDPELFDLSLKFKNDHEISMNNFTDNSTNIIYSHKPLPDSGKFMFSVKLKDIALWENGAVAFGAAPFKDTRDLKGHPGSFLIDAEKGEAYLGTQKVTFRAEKLQAEDILSLYVNLQKEWIHFSINNRIVFNDKIDTEKWEQGKTYGGIIANACERLNASFVKS